VAEVRLRRLDLTAFGSLSGVSLVLTGTSGGGLHLIYGPNEAGKSTALRAITALFFGIPERTPDDHHHGTKALKVGGVFEDAQGRLHTLVRRKKRKDALRDAEDRPVGEAVMQGLLHGLNQELYSSMFGLDHERLRSGGDALLLGKGDLAQSLFEAGVGGAGTQRLLKALTEEAEELFKPTGRTRPKLNVALDAYRAAQKQLRERQQRPEHYKEQREALEAALAERTKLEARRRALRAERAQLSRVQAALPLVSRLEESQAELSRLGGPELQAESSREQLVFAESIAELSAVVRSEQVERAELLREAQRLGAAASAQLESLGLGVTLERASALRVSPVAEAKIRRLSRERTELLTRAATLSRELSEAQRGLLEAEAVLELCGQVESRVAEQAALLHLRSQAHLEAEVAEAARAHAAEERGLQSALKKLSPWSGSPRELEGLALASRDTLKSLERRFAESDAAKSRLEERGVGLRQRLREVERRLAAIEGAFDVPSHEQLQAARAHRDGLFAELEARTASRQSTDAASVEKLLPALREALLRCDDLADRLFQQAQQVVELATFKAERRALGLELEEQAEGLGGWQRERQALEQELAARLGEAGLSALSLEQFVDWVERALGAKEACVRLAEVGLRLAGSRERQERARRALSELLVSLEGEPLGAEVAFNEGLERAERRLSLVEEQRRRRSHAEDEKARFAARIESLGESLLQLQGLRESWQGAWAEALRAFPGGAGLDPEEAQVLLEQLRGLFRLLDEQKRAEVRLFSISERAGQLAALVRLHAEPTPEELLDEAPLVLADRLVAKARAAAARVEQVRSLKQEISGTQQRLRELGAQHGLDFRALCKEVAQVDPGTLVPRLAELDAEEEQCDEALAMAAQRASSLEQGLERFGQDAAAEAAQQVEACAAEVRSLSARYRRARAAAWLLEREIERYRERHQDPLLSRAAELMARLTLGHYPRLRVGLEERTIRCVASDGTEKEVSALSEGTRDQLYLALRLASIERYLQSHEPMPLVFDDLLIQFDEERSRAALEILAELGQRTQILFLTHSEALLELARESIQPEWRAEHRLSGPLARGQQELFGAVSAAGAARAAR
jgi:uncharacterized protein YhaN